MKLKLALDAEKCGVVRGGRPPANEMLERPGAVVTAPGASFRAIAGGGGRIRPAPGEGGAGRGAPDAAERLPPPGGGCNAPNLTPPPL